MKQDKSEPKDEKPKGSTLLGADGKPVQEEPKPHRFGQFNVPPDARLTLRSDEVIRNG